MTQKQIFSGYHPPTYEACNIILMNMKNHYRRLYTAKPAVDTSPPESYKLLTRKTSRSLSCLDLSLSSLPAYKICQRLDKVNHEQSHENQRTVKPIVKRHSCVSTEKKMNQHSGLKNRVKSSATSKQKYPCPVFNNSESSKVYHLREKVYEAGKADSESSQDSAYNEGEVASSERGSRTPTPETIVNNLKHPSNARVGTSTYSRRANNHMYLKFLVEITEEILKKGVVTNRALKRIFQHHLEVNSHQLNQHRMQLELEMLCDKLGIPENDSLSSANYGLGSGNGAPSCLPLFHNLPCTDNNKTRSVLQKSLLVSKAAMAPDVLEAFTMLGDNMKLISSIQSSVKSAANNMRQVRQFTSLEGKASIKFDQKGRGSADTSEIGCLSGQNSKALDGNDVHIHNKKNGDASRKVNGLHVSKSTLIVNPESSIDMPESIGNTQFPVTRRVTPFVSSRDSNSAFDQSTGNKQGNGESQNISSNVSDLVQSSSESEEECGDNLSSGEILSNICKSRRLGKNFSESSSSAESKRSSNRNPANSSELVNTRNVEQERSEFISSQCDNGEQNLNGDKKQDIVGSQTPDYNRKGSNAFDQSEKTSATIEKSLKVEEENITRSSESLSPNSRHFSPKNSDSELRIPLNDRQCLSSPETSASEVVFPSSTDANQLSVQNLSNPSSQSSEMKSEVFIFDAKKS